MGFVQLQSENCLFYLEEKQIILIIYVDDVLVTGPRAADLQWVKQELTKVYDIHDLGKAKWILCDGVNGQKLVVGSCN